MSENILYQEDISSKDFKLKIITVYHKQNLKQDIRTKKNPLTTKSKKKTRNYRVNSGKLKLQKKSQSYCENFRTIPTI